MKKGKVVLLSGLLAFSVAGVATASALIISGANTYVDDGETDSVLYLEWGSTEDLSSVGNLTPDAPAYRMVSVAAPQKSATAPDGKFTAALGVNSSVSPEEGNTLSAEGISVSIFDKAYEKDGTNTGNRVGTGDLTIATSPISEVVTAAKVYYVKITISQEAYDMYLDVETNQKELAAKITFSYGANI